MDYVRCQPERCDAGTCPAASQCPRKLLRQEAPYEAPAIQSHLCIGCGKCGLAYPLKAIVMV